jgi:hypothetical protein
VGVHVVSDPHISRLHGRLQAVCYIPATQQISTWLFQYVLALHVAHLSNCNTDSEMVVGASKHMYNILTTNYAALFRQSSPIYVDWRKEGNFDLVGRSDALRRSFDDLRTQITMFCELIRHIMNFQLILYLIDQSTNDLSEDDALLKEWIVDQESRLRPLDPYRI